MSQPERGGESAPRQAHFHTHGLAAAGVRASARLRYSAYALLILVAASTVFGLVWLWPDYDRVSQIAERASYQTAEVGSAEGEILGIEACDTPEVVLPETERNRPVPMLPACQLLSVGLLTGPDRGHVIDTEARGTFASSGLRVGDQVQLTTFPNNDPSQQNVSSRYGLSKNYEVSGVIRYLPLAAIGLLFAAVVIVVGRLRGLLALAALGVAAAVLLGFVLPALVAGGPGLLIGVVASSAIMFVTLFFVHGLNLRTTSALIGTLAGIVIISAVSWVSVQLTRLSGLGDETSGLLSSMVSEIDFRGLLTCSILIAGLGVLNDVTITQASSVWELRAAAPQLTRREIYASAMRIGRDHIASTVYTVFFAYAGAAIGALILLYLYNRPMLILLTQEDIAIEIVRTAAGSIGLVLAVPITTAVAAMFVPAARQDGEWSARATEQGAFGGVSLG